MSEGSAEKVSIADFLGHARKGQAYLKASKLIWTANQSDKLNYIDDIELHTGPQMFLLGHATELLLKALLYSEGVTEKRIKSFKGFSYKIDDENPEEIIRSKKSVTRNHNLCFLRRLARCVLNDSSFWNKMDERISKHTYLSEKNELFLSQPSKPNIIDYNSHLWNLNNNYDRPFRVRYHKVGNMRVPNAELLIVGAQFLSEELDNRANSTRRIARALGENK